MKYGFITVASAVPAVRVADTDYNVAEIERMIRLADQQNVEIICFPELCITGYTCQDLFREQLLLEKAEEGLMQLLSNTRQLDIISVVGMPVQAGGLLLNVAVVMQKGAILGLVPKTYLPNYNEFYEKRWFASAQDLQPTEIYLAGSPIELSAVPKLFQTASGVKFGVEICEDVWAPIPPSNNLALAGAEVVLNLSASDELIGKHAYLRSLLAQQSARTISGYVYSSSGFGESTQDVVYGGNAMVFENGIVLAEGERFSFEPQMQVAQVDVERLRAERRSNTTFINAQRHARAQVVSCLHVTSTADQNFRLTRAVDPHPFIPNDEDMQGTCEEILNIQVAGLAKRLVHTNSKRVIIGISGGLDSTLALLVCVRTFDKLGYDRKGIVGVTMPGFGTSDRTHENAVSLMQSLGITSMEISIAKAVMQHFEDIGQDPNVHDVTYENAQARERTQLLMDLSNKMGGLVIGTGDLSELALGWATYNGDHMSMYGVNASVPKTLIQYLVRYIANNHVDAVSRATLLDVVDTPISPELTPADDEGNIQQKTEDLVGPYELHDFFLYYFLRFGFRPSKIFMLAKAAFHTDAVSSYATQADALAAGCYDAATIKKWLTTFCRRFFSQQFKRSCLPDGPKVGSVSLSPRGDWRMPSDAASTAWLQECEEL